MKRITVNLFMGIALVLLVSISACKKEEATLAVLSTNSLSEITSNTAIGGGNITSDGGAAIITRGVCWNTSANPTISDSKTTDGSGSGHFVSNLTGLNSSVAYYVRAYATNAVGTAYGSEVTFKTIAALPVITTSSISKISPTSAWCGGTISDDGGATITKRGVCWSNDINPTITDNKTIDGGGAGNFTSVITDLVGATVYYVRAYATNSSGTGYGMTMSFTTTGNPPNKPEIISSEAGAIHVDWADLQAYVIPNYYSTEIAFEYGTTINYGNKLIAEQSPINGYAAVFVSHIAPDLIPATTYHFRVIAVNTLGTTYGNDKVFTTLGQAPEVTAQEATNISTSSAKLTGFVNAHSLSTAVTFEYGTITSYENYIIAIQSPLIEDATNIVSAEISGLIVGTNYHFRIKAVNSLGTTFSNDCTFTTLGQAPTVLATTTTKITTGSVQLNCVVDPNYLISDVSFEYGRTTDYGNNVMVTQNPVSGDIPLSVSANITGLVENMSYHFRAKAENIIGTSYSNDQTFTTGFNVSDIDGNTYLVINIGNQVWFAENLRTTKFNDGTPIPLVTNEWGELKTPGYCWFNNDNRFKIPYGALYNWYAVSTNKLCPAGWHVPSNSEWGILIDLLGGETIAGNKLKETGNDYWYPLSPTALATNESSFTAIGGGYRWVYFEEFKRKGFWWTLSEESLYSGKSRGMASNESIVTQINHQKYVGNSVRCIKD